MCIRDRQNWFKNFKSMGIMGMIGYIYGIYHLGEKIDTYLTDVYKRQHRLCAHIIVADQCCRAVTFIADFPNDLRGLHLRSCLLYTSTKEVVARIKAVLRRCTVTTSQTESSEGVIEFDNLRLDMNSY